MAQNLTILGTKRCSGKMGSVAMWKCVHDGCSIDRLICGDKECNCRTEHKGHDIIEFGQMQPTFQNCATSPVKDEKTDNRLQNTVKPLTYEAFEKEQSAKGDKDKTLYMSTRASTNSYVSRISRVSGRQQIDFIQFKPQVGLPQVADIQPISQRQRKPDSPPSIAQPSSVNQQSSLDEPETTELKSYKTDDVRKGYGDTTVYTQIKSYVPTPFKRTYREFYGTYQLIHPPEQRLMQYKIFRELPLVEPGEPAVEGINKDWLNMTDGLLPQPQQSFQLNFLFQDVRIYINEVSKNFQKCEYVALVSGWRLNISMKHQEGYALAVDDKHCDSGEFGCVVKEEGKRVSKRIFFRPKHEWSYRSKRLKIQSAVREYSIFKLAACFGLGPDVAYTNSFDLVCYKDCVSFGMECCLSINQAIQKLSHKEYRRKNIEKKIKEDLKQCLLGLHSLHIVHKDIKPANCLYSQKSNKFVMADYGISQPLLEGFNQQTYTIYCGTRRYMSKEMVAVERMKGEAGPVNLYWNDMHSYEQTISVVKKRYGVAQEQIAGDFELPITESPRTRLDALILQGIDNATIQLFVNDLITLQDEQEVLEFLREISKYDILVKTIQHYTARRHISESMKTNLGTITNPDLFVEEQFRKQCQAVPHTERILEFQTRIFGCDPDIKKGWDKYLREAQPASPDDSISYNEFQRHKQKLYAYVNNEQATFSSTPINTADQIRKSSYIRIAAKEVVRAFQFKLLEKDDLSDMETTKIYIDLIGAEKDTNYQIVVNTNPHLINLKQLFLKNKDRWKPRNSKLIGCMIAIWENRHTAKQQIDEFITEFQGDRDICVCIRGLYEAYRVKDNKIEAYKLLDRQEQVRIQQGCLNTVEGVVMYYCRMNTSPSPKERQENCLKGLNAIDLMPQYSAADYHARRFVLQLKGYFLMTVFKYDQAVEVFEDLLAYYQKANIRVSLYLSHIQDNIQAILLKQGKLNESLKTCTEVWQLRTALTDSQRSPQGLDISYRIGMIYFKKGEYAKAINQCNAIKQEVDQLDPSGVKYMRSYQVLCFEGQILLESGQFGACNAVLESCEKLYLEASSRKDVILRHMHPTLRARYYSRLGKYQLAEQEINGTDLVKFNGPEQQALYYLVKTEIAVLSMQFDERYQQAKRGFEAAYNKLRLDAILRAEMLLLEARAVFLGSQIDSLLDVHSKCNQLLILLKDCSGHPWLGEVHLLLSYILHVQGNFKESDNHRKESDEIFGKQRSWLRQYYHPQRQQ